MGLLTEGRPLTWQQLKGTLAQYIKEQGIKQFIHFYTLHKDKGIHPDQSGDWFKWGDELEGMIVQFDHKNKKARLALKSEAILNKLWEQNPQCCKYTVEFGAYMVECIPHRPYGDIMDCSNIVEDNMKLRHQRVQNLLEDDEYYFFISVFPRLGCYDCLTPFSTPSPADNPASLSLYLSDEGIFPGHPRFKSMASNIRQRRGANVNIQVPIFQDSKTPHPFVEDPQCPLHQEGQIHMDCQLFGMGACCLQVTFQAYSLKEATQLYDQLSVLTPIMMALSAATPICKGFLTDEDSRWNVIQQCVDDRTPYERGETQDKVEGDRFVIPKPRYSSIDLYISDCGTRFNDTDVPFNADFYKEMIEAGVEAPIAKHVAHLFIRDPVVAYEELLVQDNTKSTDHFENINSTNWQAMRFKLPPPDSDIGWRVEFRPMDIQLTALENSAMAVFIVLLSRVILTYDLQLLIPMSELESNFVRATKRDAVLQEKFTFRKHLNIPQSLNNECPFVGNAEAGFMVAKDECIHLCCKKMTVNEIINGDDSGFVGLVPLLENYLNSIEEVDVKVRCSIKSYLKLISQRASGKLLTLASWTRNFVRSHPAYEHDSRVSDVIQYDLLMRFKQMSSGEIHDITLFP